MAGFKPVIPQANGAPVPAKFKHNHVVSAENKPVLTVFGELASPRWHLKAAAIAAHKAVMPDTGHHVQAKESALPTTRNLNPAAQVEHNLPPAKTTARGVRLGPAPAQTRTSPVPPVPVTLLTIWACAWRCNKSAAAIGNIEFAATTGRSTQTTQSRSKTTTTQPALNSVRTLSSPERFVQPGMPSP
jgi:hypothetical protein